ARRDRPHPRHPARGVSAPATAGRFGAGRRSGRRVRTGGYRFDHVSPMNRDEIFQVIRRHLADELEVDPAAISESTRFKEDLEADSLDLYTLVQELEDSYGVRISDDQAAQIRTVGQAVDFVLSVRGGEAPASAPASAGRDAE